jgi:general secretion pathway protein L
VVAVLPAAQLSWHRVQLPRGVGPRSPRLRATLAGLLEEQLLDEPEQLHFALAPTPARAAAWVAVCHSRWLAAHLQALDAAGRPVARIVPERSPEPGELQLDFTGEPERAQLLVSGGPDGGAQALPWSAGTLALLQARLGQALATARVQAEPAVAALAEQLGPPAHATRRPSACCRPAPRAGTWRRASWRAPAPARASRRAGAAWRSFWHAPRGARRAGAWGCCWGCRSWASTSPHGRPAASWPRAARRSTPR